MKRYRIKKTIIFKKIDNGIVVLDEKNSKIRELNETATLIFENLKNWTTLNQIVDKIAHEYDSDQNILLKDVTEFVMLYIDLGIIEFKGA